MRIEDYSIIIHPKSRNPIGVPETHREAFPKAKSAGKSLNAWVKEVIQSSAKR